MNPEHLVFTWFDIESNKKFSLPLVLKSELFSGNWTLIPINNSIFDWLFKFTLSIFGNEKTFSLKKRIKKV